jgi:hypothetical protein
MPYGYLGQNLPNQTKANSGVFSISDVASLEKQGKFGGSLELIEEKSISASSSAIFTDIKETVYDVHYLTVNDCQVSTDNTALQMRFFESGVEESASVYQRAQFIIDSSSANAEFRSTGTSAFVNIWNIGSATGESGNSYTYLYNLGDSNKYSFITGQEIHMSSVPYARTSFGGGVLPQASTVDEIKLFVSSGTFSATAKLYGVKQI